MFHADSLIETIQNSKHQFIKNFIHNKEIADAWTNFVETQATFCHAVVNTTDTMIRKMTEPHGIDWLSVGLDQWVKQGNSPK